MSANPIQLTVLGGGQSIGKSCFLLSVQNQHVLLDCGSYVGKDTKKALPDFSRLPKNVRIDDISVVLISHFHMDHVGGLLYLTEQLKYKGPIFASGPTRAVLPLILVNNRALMSNQSQSQSGISVEKCTNLTKHIREVAVREQIQVNPHLRVTPHIAGHVLGAVMWEIEIDGKRILYTGDYSGDEGGVIPSYQVSSSLLPLDMLIMECTYGNTDFKSLEDRRNQLIQSITSTIQEGGKVLIPCYGIGYTQELIAMIQKAWEDHNFTAPIYYSSQDTKSTLPLFSLFSIWTSRTLSINQNKIQFFHLDYARSQDPFLLLAPHPSMTTGVAKTVFPSIADDEKNMVIFLGNNPPDSYAGYIMKENAKIGENGDMPVKCKRKVIPFSAHPDRQCNCQLINLLKPECVVLVHGDKQNCTGFIKYYLKHHEQAPLFLMPENGKTISFCPASTQVFLSESDHWECMKRRKLEEGVVCRITGRIMEVQKEGDYCDLLESAILDISEEAWKASNPPFFLNYEGIEEKRVKVKWNVQFRKEAITVLNKFSVKWNVLRENTLII